MKGHFKIGIVAGTHGIKGEIRVFPTTDEPTRFYNLKELIFDHSGNIFKYKIERLYIKNKFIIIKLAGISNMNDALKLKGTKIMIPDELAIPLYEDEYYIRDLYGLLVYTEDDTFLGELTDVITTGANDVYVVKDMSNISNKSLLIPAIKQCILNVDIQKNKMLVKLLQEDSENETDNILEENLETELNEELS